jgi:hypothetical protein
MTQTVMRVQVSVQLDVVPTRTCAGPEAVRHIVSTALRWALHGGHAGFDVAGLHDMRVEVVTDDPPAMSPEDAAAYRIGLDAGRALDALMGDVQAPDGYLRCPNCAGLMPASRLVCLTCLHRR